ncbi:hypothetical protein CN378_03100 [Bacillus sp. AFS015802]|uniref:hypothetical protein n=1 Tax=Bacillus sp. AFS015802 TaxID=2033486 RepID=UPI000BF2BA58|nr:hypothetical protein [Bacillus sp. AFS015802]PFA69768.1 hypothetical protein CN378_03100 [Bacillus sp. AFS015802]
MSRKNLLLSVGVAIIISMSWFAYHKITDDTYKGMSIIPEQHEDIPLYKGLKPTRSQYVIKGNRWEDIYGFYMNKLPSLGWKIEYVQSGLDDNDVENDWSGFSSRWRKEGFDGELWISSNYNQFDEETEVIFDKTPIYQSTSWIEELPNSICIYETLHQEDCVVIDDKTNLKGIKTLINKAIDWNDEKLPNREKSSVIEFGNLDIKVYYGNDKEIYFQSQKGTKIMKPEPEFFELTNLSQ